MLTGVVSATGATAGAEGGVVVGVAVGAVAAAALASARALSAAVLATSAASAAFTMTLNLWVAATRTSSPAVRAAWYAASATFFASPAVTAASRAVFRASDAAARSSSVVAAASAALASSTALSAAVLAAPAALAAFHASASLAWGLLRISPTSLLPASLAARARSYSFCADAAACSSRARSAAPSSCDRPGEVLSARAGPAENRMAGVITAAMAAVASVRRTFMEDPPLGRNMRKRQRRCAHAVEAG